MAEAKRKTEGSNDALLRRLRRLTARAGTVEASDRAQLLALLDDIDKVRRELLRECARLDDEIQRAAIRVTAVTAYARGARSVRGPHRGGRK